MSALQRYLQFNDPDRLWLRGLRIQARVIGALMLRDAVAKFGHENLGFFWIIGEPMLLTAGVMVMWAITGSGHGGHISVIPFALTGYSFITLWRHVVGRAIRGLTRSGPLLYLGYVKFFDVLLAGFLLELVAILAAFFIVYIPLALLGLVPVLHDPILMLGGWVLTGWFAFGFSLVLAALSEFSEPAERFIQPVMYITLPFTGVSLQLSSQFFNLLRFPAIGFNSIRPYAGGFTLNSAAYDPYDPYDPYEWMLLARSRAGHGPVQRLGRAGGKEYATLAGLTDPRSLSPITRSISTAGGLALASSDGRGRCEGSAGAGSLAYGPYDPYDPYDPMTP